MYRHADSFWSQWTFTFRPKGGGSTIIDAALQVHRPETSDKLTTCKTYLQEALQAAQRTPGDWWKTHGRSICYLMELCEPPKEQKPDGWWLDQNAAFAIPWLNRKLGYLEQATESVATRKVAVDFLVKWHQCSLIEKDPCCR